MTEKYWMVGDEQPLKFFSLEVVYSVVVDFLSCQLVNL